MENFQLDYTKQAEWENKGHRQSPINIEKSCIQKAPAHLQSFQLALSKEAPKIFNSGQNLQLKGEGKGIFQGKVYEFTQLHFHTPSEHTFRKKHYALEGHFVFQRPKEQVVLAVLYKIGLENPDFAEILQEFQEKQPAASFATTRLLPKNLDYYYYEGSLTTPPFLENVHWYVLKNSLEISEAQQNIFQRIHGKNCRHLQPLNQRLVYDFQEK